MKKFKYIFLALALSLGFLFTKSTGVGADQDPANCNASGLQEFPSINPATVVYDGDALTYSVIYINADPDGAGPVAPCNVTGANASITLPDASVVNVLTNATLNVGVVINCPGDAGCVAGPYTYNVNHSDEVGSSVTAAFHIDGVLHQDANEESASDDDTLSKTVIHPTTVTTISASATQVIAGGTVDLTVTEENDGDVDLTSAQVGVDNGVGTLDSSSAGFSGDDGDGVLEPGETWQWLVSGVAVNADTTFTATGFGTDPLGNVVTYPDDPEEQDAVDVDTVSPTTITTISSSLTSVYTGDTVTLTVTEENDGDTDLTNAHVDVDNGVGTLDSSSANFSGDDGDGVLEPGEIWQWLVDVTVSADTTYIATGHGTDPFQNDVTFPADQDEQDTVSVDTVNPSTILTKTSSDTQVLAGDSVTYTYTEENDGDVALTDPSVEDDTCSPVVYQSGDTNTNGVLDPGEIWVYSCTMVLTATTTNVAIGHGTDPIGNDVTWCGDIIVAQEGILCDQDERAEARVEVLSPTTITAIVASAIEVAPGDSVTLTVTEENDGDTDLTNAHVDVDNGVGTLDSSSANFSGDDGDAVLEPGETWMWTVDVTVNATTTYTATGHGTDPFGNDVTYPADPEEQDAVTVEVVELGCTLTQGYWKTHSDQGPAPYDSEGWGNLGDYDGDGTDEEEGEELAYGKTWYEVFQTAPKGGNVWYQLAHQWMAAYLNMLTGASTPSEVSDALTDAEAWLTSHDPASNPKANQYPDAGNWASILGSYNEGLIGPGHCEE